jgi:dolichol-phosphate mannosyltransferase
VTAAFNEARNLPLLHASLCSTLDALEVDWDWIIVDDHSRDNTFEAIQRLASKDPRVRGMRFSRNFGSHLAIACGLQQATGDCTVILAGDCQDPPETIPQLLEQWRSGAEVVWAARRRRADERRSAAIFPRLYYTLMRRIVGVREIPAQGADFFLIGRRAIDAVCDSDEGHVSILGFIAWMGFPQATVEYDKQPRRHGSSGWSLEKKLKLVADSITAFSYLPIRAMSLLGILFALGGFALAAFTVIERILGYSAAHAGYAMITTVLLLGFGFVMMFLGILGEYLWRTFDQVRGRPRYIVESRVGRFTRPGPRRLPLGSSRSATEVPAEDVPDVLEAW